MQTQSFIPQSLFELLCELVRIQPVTDDVPAVNRAVARVKKYLDDAGLHTALETFDGRDVLFASTRPGKVHRLFFNAHLDVVPPSEDGQDIPELRGDRLYGRGTADCLGNSLTAMQAIIQAGPDADAAILFSTNEEKGGSTVGRMIEAGYRPTDLAVVWDAANLGDLVIAQKGIVSMNLTAHGRGGHSSAPWAYDNPILTLVSALKNLDDAVKDRDERWAAEHPGNTWRDSFAPCILRAGSTHNQIPDTAEAILNCRYVTPGGEQEIIDFVRNATGLDDITVLQQCPPVTCDPGHPTIQALREALQALQPQTPICFRKMTGATDARYFSPLGLPIAIMGVNGDGVHAKGEYVCLSAMKDALKAVVPFIRTFN